MCMCEILICFCGKYCILCLLSLLRALDSCLAMAVCITRLCLAPLKLLTFFIFSCKHHIKYVSSCQLIPNTLMCMCHHRIQLQRPSDLNCYIRLGLTWQIKHIIMWQSFLSRVRFFLVTHCAKVMCECVCFPRFNEANFFNMPEKVKSMIKNTDVNTVWTQQRTKYN